MAPNARAKLIAMGILVLIALLLAIIFGHVWHWLVFMALTVSWVGDAFMARFTPLLRRVGMVDPFLAGMAAFSVAQVVYTVAFWRSIQSMPLLHVALPGFMLGEVILPNVFPVYVLAGLMFWVWTVMRARRPRGLKAAALVYCLLVSTMGAFACAAGFTGVVLAWQLIVGGILFIVSDAFIAARVFADHIPNNRTYELLVWGTYFPAQVLLLWGTSWLY